MKRGMCAVLAIAMAVCLPACGSAKETVVTTEEIVVPEMSSKDILVNSLEYLLEEENGEEKEGEEKEEKPEEDAAEAETAQTREKDNETKEKEALICFGKDMKSALTQETITAEEITPDVLLNALARHNIVPLLDTKALSMEEKEEDGKKILYLDLSGSFREYLMTMSMEAECIIISSIANTFLTNFDADALCITVEGETLVTSNAAYTEAVLACTPAEMMARLQDTEAGGEENG